MTFRGPIEWNQDRAHNTHFISLIAKKGKFRHCRPVVDERRLPDRKEQKATCHVVQAPIYDSPPHLLR